MEREQLKRLAEQFKASEAKRLRSGSQPQGAAEERQLDAAIASNDVETMRAALHSFLPYTGNLPWRNVVAIAMAFGLSDALIELKLNHAYWIRRVMHGFPAAYLEHRMLNTASGMEDDLQHSLYARMYRGQTRLSKKEQLFEEQENEQIVSPWFLLYQECEKIANKLQSMASLPPLATTNHLGKFVPHVLQDLRWDSANNIVFQDLDAEFKLWSLSLASKSVAIADPNARIVQRLGRQYVWTRDNDARAFSTIPLPVDIAPRMAEFLRAWDSDEGRGYVIGGMHFDGWSLPDRARIGTYQDIMAYLESDRDIVDPEVDEDGYVDMIDQMFPRKVPTNAGIGLIDGALVDYAGGKIEFVDNTVPPLVFPSLASRYRIIAVMRTIFPDGVPEADQFTYASIPSLVLIAGGAGNYHRDMENLKFLIRDYFYFNGWLSGETPDGWRAYNLNSYIQARDAGDWRAYKGVELPEKTFLVVGGQKIAVFKHKPLGVSVHFVSIRKPDILVSCRICTLPTKQRCSGCANAVYCSETCQRTEWPTHGPTCKQ